MPSTFTIGVDFGTNSVRALVVDTLIQYHTNRLVEKGNFIGAKAVCRAQRVNSGVVQAFVGVNVANPGNERLVEQQGFDLPMTPGQTVAQGIDSKLIRQRFRAEGRREFG